MTTALAALPAHVEPALRVVAAQLRGAGIEPAMTEARMILALAGFDRMDLIRAPQRELTAIETQTILAALDKRLGGMPTARIAGRKHFAGADFLLSPGTLEPRDDTQALLDAVLPFLAERPRGRVLDIGTGTGIVAISLLRRFANLMAVATDISADALATAQRNAQALGVADRFDGRLGDLFADAEGVFDLIISNPPYIASAEIDGLDREVREHDPRAALDGGPDGLVFYRRIAAEAAKRLAPGGCVAVEIGHDQGQSVPAVFAGHGWLPPRLHLDLGGRPRALVFRR